MDKHPYISSGGPIAQAFTQFRKSLPPKIDADVLKKLGLAPNNESYLINILRFLELIDEEGNPTEKNKGIFFAGSDEDFEKEFEPIVADAYSELFSLHGPSAWDLDEPKLIQFFRKNDSTSEIVGKRQAKTFLALAGLSGKADPVTVKATKPAGTKSTTKPKASKSSKSSTAPKATPQNQNPGSASITESNNGYNLTVRVEINLPSDASKKTYDEIFKSLKENLISDG